MLCTGHSKTSVAAALERLPGVKKVEVSLENDRAVGIEADIKDRAKALLVTINDAERVDLDSKL